MAHFDATDADFDAPAVARAPAVRYRRKVEAASDNQRDTKSDHGPRSEDGDAEQDNQREHEAAAVVAPLRKQKPLGRKKTQGKQQAGKKDARRSPRRNDRGGYAFSSKRGTAGLTRLGPAAAAGKDWKEDAKKLEEVDAEPVEAHREPETVGDVADAESNNSPEAESSLQEPTTARQTDSQQRRDQKQPKRRTKHLVWRVKAQQGPAAPATVETAPTASSFSKPAADEPDDEAEFAMRERKLLKMRAKEVSYPLESSSQETQSGSDDDSATFLQFSTPPVRSSGPSTVIPIFDEVETSNADDTFPKPFPLERIDSLHANQVHEVAIADYAFQPEQLKVSTGDVVVWRVSDQTLQMVEHCLRATLTHEVDETTTTGVTPTLSAGDRFAWRFTDVGAVSISCSVYDVHGSVVVASPTESPVVYKRSQRSNQTAKKAKKWKKRRNSPANGQAPTSSAGSVEEEAESVEVFHCPPQLLDHSAYPSIDIALRDAVLSQLDVVANAAISGVNASTGLLPVIVVGDVACPVLDDVHEDVVAISEQSDAEVAAEADDQVADFQERVIAMLKRSEESQALQRRSFTVDESGFDAEGAYDFLKHRTFLCALGRSHVLC